MAKKPAKRKRRRWVEVPVPPTKEMLRSMSQATFLTDGSDLEMIRRFNGMLEAVPKRKTKRTTLRP